MRKSGSTERTGPRDPRNAPPRRRWSLRDLRLRKRLVLLVLVPLVAGVALASARVASEATTIRSENELSGQARVALNLAGLVYTVEDERDAVEVYLTDGEQPADAAALARAQAVTQSRVAGFESAELTYGSALAALPASDQTLMRQAVARLGDLSTLRASVTSLGASRPIYQAYTTIVGDLLNFSGQLATDTTDHALAAYVGTLSLVEQAGEQTSQERGYLVGILGGGGQLLSQEEDLVQAQAQYNSTLADIDAQAPAPIVDLYQAQVGGDETGSADSTVQQTIDAALQDFPVSQVGATVPAAYAQSTAKVNQIRGIEQVVAQDITARTSVLLSEATEDLYLNAGIIVAVLLLAFLGTAVIARSIARPLRVLRTSALEIAGVRLPAVIEQLRDPRRAEAQAGMEVLPIAIDSRDEIGSVARAFDEVHYAAVRLASEQALLRSSVNAVFTNLSRRSQTLVERQLQLIDDLESGEREPGRLAQLFRLDHLATRMRRNNENLLVLAGEETARRWTEAVRLVDVARAAAAEVEQYERIILGEMPRVGIIGKAAPDVAHLIAELLENATAFSAPRTKVWIAARPADDAGVVLRIEDAGIGMKRPELDEANDRMNNPPVVDVSIARRMGLYVVGRLASRYGIQVRLGESQVGGVAALIHLPATLLSEGVEQLQPGPGQETDDEFYMLSRQFAHGANQGLGDGRVADQSPMAGTVAAAVLGESAARQQERGARPEPAPWYDSRFAAAPPDGQGRLGGPGPDMHAGRPTGVTWFQPSEDRGDGDGPQPKRSAAEAAIARADAQEADLGGVDDRLGAFGRSSAAARRREPQPFPAEQEPGGGLPQRRQRNPTQPLPQHHAKPATWQPEPEPESMEPTPIFEAIESEWFRRREEARAQRAPRDPSQDPVLIPRQPDSPHDQSLRSAQPAQTGQAGQGGHVGQVGQTGQGAGEPEAGYAAAPSHDPSTAGRPGAPGAPGTVPAPTVSPAAVVRSWSSPGDDGWRAAQALSRPSHDGQTASGLPRRTPRANLVPGSAGGTGAARAVPPPNLRHDPSQGGRP